MPTLGLPKDRAIRSSLRCPRRRTTAPWHDALAGPDALEYAPMLVERLRQLRERRGRLRFARRWTGAAAFQRELPKWGT